MRMALEYTTVILHRLPSRPYSGLHRNHFGVLLAFNSQGRARNDGGIKKQENPRVPGSLYLTLLRRLTYGDITCSDESIRFWVPYIRKRWYRTPRGLKLSAIMSSIESTQKAKRTWYRTTRWVARFDKEVYSNSKIKIQVQCSCYRHCRIYRPWMWVHW